MKKIVLPALLCLAYSSLLVGFFSTDFSKQHSFLFQQGPKQVLQKLEPAAAMIGVLPRDKAVVVPVGQTVGNTQTLGGASPESAVK